MGFFSWLTSGTKAAENATEIGAKITDGVIGGLDALFYTEQEKAESAKERAQLVLDFWKTFANENSIRSVTRRILAVMSFIVFFFLVLLSVLVYPIQAGAFNGAVYAQFIFSWVKELFWLWMMIAGTYFIPHQVAKVWKSKNAE